MNISLSTLPLLGILFVGLKLTGYITWPWLYVTMPFWGGLAILAVILVCAILVLLALLAYEAYLDWKDK